MGKDATRTGTSVFPFLRYQDAPAAIEWLAKAFGFEERAVYPGPDGTVSHAEMSLGRGMIMLSSAKDDALGMKTPRGLGAVTQGIYVYVEDVDAHHERAKAAGAEIVIELQDTHYGSREYAARDPEGNLWSFGTYAPPTWAG